jgi:hypothetical protein
MLSFKIKLIFQYPVSLIAKNGIKTDALDLGWGCG